MKEIVINGKKFVVLKKLGKGSFGKVYKVEYLGNNFALKIIKSKSTEGVKALRELDIMARIDHPNLMKAEKIIAEYIEKTSKKGKDKSFSRVGVLMELANRDLHNANYDDSFSLTERLNILKQITEGVSFLHESHYLHLDIKPANILLFNDDRIGRLTDFGLSLRLNGERYRDFPIEIITITYRSINILSGEKRYTEADDIWSLGITFLEILSGKCLFRHLKKGEDTNENIIKVITEKLSPKTIDDTLDKSLPSLNNKEKIISLLKQMLDFNSRNRPSAASVLQSLSFIPLFEGKVAKVSRLPPLNCNVLAYEGFDILVRLSTRIPIKLETFFLAADLYQRSLANSHQTTGKWSQDYKNIAFQASLALYMAIKMIEPFFADTKIISDLTDNLFSEKYLIIGETIMINAWGGAIYPDNLFTNSKTLARLNEALEISKNCHVYYRLDFPEWGKLDQQEAVTSEVYSNKWGDFLPFFLESSYYDNFSDLTRSYISKIYNEDKIKMIN